MPDPEYLLLVIYTSRDEYEPEVSLMATRLRFGADEWDFPSPLLDTPGANDHAPLLADDRGMLRLFWGNPQAEGHYPFNMTASADSGATWGEVQLPSVTGPVGDLDKPQPINTFLDKMTLSGARERIARKSYIRALNNANPGFDKAMARAKADPSWRTYDVACGHDVMVDMPERLAEILLEVA